MLVLLYGCSATASFSQMFGGLMIPSPVGTITALSCGTATNNGTLTSGTVASGVSSVIPYTGGNGGIHSGQVVTSTGVTGLTATLTASTLASGAGSLTYTIAGTPASSGTASFTLNIGGQTCTLILTVGTLSSLYAPGSVFCSGSPTLIFNVTGPSTGNVWMDRNLGATQAAISKTDAAAYGDVYHWGRRTEGHQCRTSLTPSTLSSTDQPANGNFITNISNLDWRSPQNTNLWQGVNGVNNPCPSGYRIPTETELNAERLSWAPFYNDAGAFASPLKLTLGGIRFWNGSVSSVDSYGNYWTSTINTTQSRYLDFFSGNAFMDNFSRVSGLSVRCIKN